VCERRAGAAVSGRRRGVLGGAGGTKTAPVFDVTKSAAKAFGDLMAEIEAAARTPCRFALPASSSPLDPHTVNLEYTPAGASKPVFAASVTSAASCDVATGGWYYDNPTSPQQIILCPESCAALGKAPLTIELGCATRTAPL
jgi:hypothetical protein